MGELLLLPLFAGTHYSTQHTTYPAVSYIIPGSLLQHTRQSPTTYPAVSYNIPGSLLQHTRQSPTTYPAVSYNIPGSLLISMYSSLMNFLCSSVLLMVGFSGFSGSPSLRRSLSFSACCCSSSVVSTSRPLSAKRSRRL